LSLLLLPWPPAGQQEVIASGAASYIHLACPALLLSAGSYSLSNYLAAQATVWPLVGVAGVTMSLTPGLNHLFMKSAGWGFLGAAGTLVVVHAVELLLLLAAASWHNAR
jgi:Na+-driven multidrug efflux pump